MATDNWKRRWAMIRLVTITASAMGLGLYFIEPELAAQIAAPVALIATALVGLVSVYMGAATWGDKG